MKILMLSTSDKEGGAARATYRLHQGLQSIGVSSTMLVRAKISTNQTVMADKTVLTKFGPSSSGWPLRLYPNRNKKLFSPQWFPDALAEKVKAIAPDIINLNWICNGFLQIETLAKFSQPLVWTLHDMWPFTGGCHYGDGCDRYSHSCGRCPQLQSQKEKDLSHWVWQRKRKAWEKLNLTLVSPSQWLADCARGSSLFANVPIQVIPHGLDITKYKPIDRQIARELLNLPPNRSLILFGASPGTTGDQRKGLHLLQPALAKLAGLNGNNTIELVIFGESEPREPINLGFKTHYLGQFADDIALALVYSSADVMVVPSLQEAFGQTASEALACGTPVVAFGATGLKDIVEHQRDGYLAQPFEVEDLAQGIAWVLADKDRYSELCVNARAKVEQKFSLELQAEKYLRLYTELLTP